MMEQILLEGAFFCSWIGSIPPQALQHVEEAKAGINGYTYQIVAPADYPEGESADRWDVTTGKRIVRSDPPEGYQYDGQGIDAALVPADDSIALTAWIEEHCDEVDAEWRRRQKSGFLHTDGLRYPLDHEAQTSYHIEYDMVRQGLLSEPFARTTTNVNTFMTVDAFVSFCMSAFSNGNALQMARSGAKDDMRACTTYAAALATFEEYMGGSS